jgi:L-lactate dehydrogenase complex protein LldG
MMDQTACFIEALSKVGGQAVAVADVTEAARYVKEHLQGELLFPESPSLDRWGMRAALSAAGAALIDHVSRASAPRAEAGLTGANFAIAATGTIALESTAEPLRLASTLPVKHFVVLDPRKIVADSSAAVPVLRRFHNCLPQAYLAYITGPSRTADIERVLTIGVHGPKELHILLCGGVSDDFMES